MYVIPLIVIDTSDISLRFSLSKQEIDNMLDNIAKGLAVAYAEKLEGIAQRELHQTRRRYIQSIKLIDSGKFEGTVMLDYSKDPVVKMIEEGASAFDIKKGLLDSIKAKYTKDGRKYITVPFRLGSPGAIGDSGVFSSILPQSVYDVLKSRATNIPVSGGGVRSKGLMLADIPSLYQPQQTRQAIVDNEGNEQFKAYQHKNSLYEGAMKVTDNVTGQSGYQSFRRVSESGTTANGKKKGSDPDAFIHPGIERYALMQKALDEFNIQQELSLQLDNEFTKLGF